MIEPGYITDYIYNDLCSNEGRFSEDFPENQIIYSLLAAITKS